MSVGSKFNYFLQALPLNIRQSRMEMIAKYQQNRATSTRENSDKMACATSKDSDQPALIRAFAGRLDFLLVVS